MKSNVAHVMEEFYQLVRKAVDVENNHLEMPIESEFSSVLEFVIAHPDQKKDFAKAFIHILNDPEITSPQLIQYCMHVLRWPELKSYFSEWLASEKSERVRHVLRKIVWSFNDDWWDADMYARFNKDK